MTDSSEQVRLTDPSLKIAPEAYFDVADSIFNKASPFSGKALAALVGVPVNTAWNWMFRRGVNAQEARALAKGIDQWVTRLHGYAMHLRQLADDLESGALAPMDYRPWSKLRNQRRPGKEHYRPRGPNKRTREQREAAKRAEAEGSYGPGAVELQLDDVQVPVVVGLESTNGHHPSAAEERAGDATDEHAEPDVADTTDPVPASLEPQPVVRHVDQAPRRFQFR